MKTQPNDPELKNTDGQRHISMKRKVNLKELSILIAFALIVTVLAFASEHFFTISNLTNILLQSSHIMLMAIGLTFVIISGNVDLSIGSIQALSAAIVSVTLVNLNLPLPIAILFALISGLVCGIANGIFVARFRFPPFIATLGMQGVARGVGLIITGGVAIIGFPRTFAFIGRGQVAGTVPFPVVLFFIIMIIAHIVLKHTKFGVNVYAVGSNEQAARLSGVNVQGVKIAVFAMSGVLSAMAGIVMTSRLNAGLATIGEFDVLDTLAAVVIGGTSMRGGVGSIRGAFIGVIMISVIRNGLNLLGIDAYVQQVAIGLLILTAILIDQFSKGELK